MIDRNKVAEICTAQGLQPKSDDLGMYWVHPDFKDKLMIDIDDNGNWEDGTPDQQRNFEKELGLQFDNTSAVELERYLTALVEKLCLQGKTPEES